MKSHQSATLQPGSTNPLPLWRPGSLTTLLPFVRPTTLHLVEVAPPDDDFPPDALRPRPFEPEFFFEFDMSNLPTSQVFINEFKIQWKERKKYSSLIPPYLCTVGKDDVFECMHYLLLLLLIYFPLSRAIDTM